MHVQRGDSLSMTYNGAFHEDANELVAESPTSVAGSCNVAESQVKMGVKQNMKKAAKQEKCTRKKAKKGSRKRKNLEKSSCNGP